MKLSTKSKGQKGEELAVRFLQLHGFTIIERNFKSRYGEIDIIARRKDSIYFVEVKYRYDQAFGQAIESIHYFKQRKIFKMSWIFLYRNPVYMNYSKRFAVLGVERSQDGISYDFIDNALELSV